MTRIEDHQRDVHRLVAEEVVAVSLAVAAVVERLAVIGGDDDDGVALASELAQGRQDARGRRVDAADGAVVETAQLLLVFLVDEPLVAAEADGLVVLEAASIRGMRVRALPRVRRGVGEVDRGEEDGEEERIGTRRELAEQAHGVAGEQLGIGGGVRRAQGGEGGASRRRDEKREQRRLALEGAFASEGGQIEARDLGAGEAEIDATEDVAGVVAGDRGGVAGVGEARGERVEVAGALLVAREHGADAVVLRVATGEECRPRGEGARQADVGAFEAGAASGERGEVGGDARIEAISAERVDREDEDIRTRRRTV